MHRDYHAVIADFGLTLFSHGHSRNYASERAGNKGWMAPELTDKMLQVTGRPTPESDVYSFAIVCMEVCTKEPHMDFIDRTCKIYLGHPPFGTSEHEAALFATSVLNGDRPKRPPLPVSLKTESSEDLMPLELWEVVQDCWKAHAEQRPSAAEAHRRITQLGLFASLGTEGKAENDQAEQEV